MPARPAYRPIVERIGSVLASVGRFTRWLLLGSKRFPPRGGRSPQELRERQSEDFNLAGLRLGGYGG